MGNRKRNGKNKKQQSRRVPLGVAANLDARRVMVRLGDQRVVHLDRDQAIQFALAVIQCAKAIDTERACETCGGAGIVERQEYDGGPWDSVLCECRARKAGGPPRDEPPAPHQHEEPTEQPPNLDNVGQGMTVAQRFRALQELAKLRAALGSGPEPEPPAVAAAHRGQLGQ